MVIHIAQIHHRIDRAFLHGTFKPWHSLRIVLAQIGRHARSKQFIGSHAGTFLLIGQHQTINAPTFHLHLIVRESQVHRHVAGRKQTEVFRTAGDVDPSLIPSAYYFPYHITLHTHQDIRHFHLQHCTLVLHLVQPPLTLSYRLTLRKLQTLHLQFLSLQT